LTWTDVDENSDLLAFQENLGYFFRDRGLLTTALSHASFAYENGRMDSNERLEFLGDSVLGLITAHVLYETLPDATEGELTENRADFVCRDALSQWAERLDIGRVLRTGKSLENIPPSIFADATEAVLGAVYLDGGYDAAVRVVRRYLFGRGVGGRELDAKSRLQTLLQAEHMGLPRYETLSVTGPSHSPSFNVRVHVAGKIWPGKGASRKAAEMAAATAALEELAREEQKEKGRAE